MKTDWQTKKLGDVCEIINGSTPLRSNKSFWDHGDVPWFTIDDIREQGRIIQYTKQKITKQALGKTSARLLPPESILLCCTASVGEYAITKIPLTTNQQFNGLIAKDKKSLDSGFLFYFSSTLRDQLLGLSGKTTIDFIPISRLKGIEIRLPLLSEQKRIVKKLDEVFDNMATAKENVENNLQNSKELFESYLQSVFAHPGKGWKEKKLNEIYQIGSSKRVMKSQWRTEGVPFYRGREITRLAADGHVNNELFISEAHYQELLKQSGVPKSGDIVITAIGTIGNLHIVREGDKFYFKDASVLWMKRVTDVNSEFVKFWLKSALFFNQLDKDNGATVDTLTIKKLQNVELYLPNLREQQEVVKKLKTLLVETKKLEKIYAQKLADLEELKKSVLQKAFAGEL